MARTNSKTKKDQSETYLDKVSIQVESNQSRFSMILGGLIILVVVVLLFNYFNKSNPAIGPSQQTQQQTQGDVTPENLPGKYTVKEGDTLFTIAESYYKDGYKYTEIAQANNLTNPNSIEIGQKLEIPKISDKTLSDIASPKPTDQLMAETPSPTSSPESQPSPTEQPTPQAQEMQGGQTTGTAPTQVWGAPITGATYTVVEGDWLSTIAARAYNGDLMAYTKIAQANNIQNADLILPGMVLTLPR